MTAVSLNRMARTLKVHPRTVLRYLHNNRHYSWQDDDDPQVGIEAVAEAFECDPVHIKRALEHKDEILKPAEAAKMAGVTHMRTFWRQNHEPIIRIGRVTRYSLLKINEWVAARF